MAKRQKSRVGLLLGVLAVLAVVGVLVSWLLSSSTTTKKTSPTSVVDNVVDTANSWASDAWAAIGDAGDAYVETVTDFWSGAWEKVSGTFSSEPLPDGVESDPSSDPYGESREL